MVKLALQLTLLFGLVFMTACSAQTTPSAAPTQDLSALRTEVAATVLAQVPQICAQTQSAILPPTQTPKPTATITLTPTLAPTGTAAANATVSATAGTVVATAAVTDLAKWVAQTIPDNTHFAPGTPFTLVWRLQNVGTSTWTNKYVLRFFGGNALGAPAEIAVDKDVLPNETIDFTIQMKAPNTPGEYTSSWVMSSDVRRNFKEAVFLKIIVDAPTATPTKTRTPTTAPSATPTK
jgi:hypothetical protein